MAIVDPKVGKTVIYSQAEINPVYMLSELIDNAFAAYEESGMLSGNDERDIIVRFDSQEGFISVQDFATGFNVKSALSNWGTNKFSLDKNGHFKVNQYYEGMKDAMKFFSIYSVAVSEEKNGNSTKRTANCFIRGKGVNDAEIELPATGVLGSTIYLFADRKQFISFWEKTGLNTSSVREIIDAAEDEDKYGVAGDLLRSDKMKKRFPQITESLFERYSPLVNKYDKLVIKFQAVDAKGKQYFDDNNPVWIKEVRKISPSYDELLALDFSIFREQNSAFYEKLADNKEFAAKWYKFMNNLVVSDFLTYFKNAKKKADDKSDFESINMPDDMEILNNPAPEFNDYEIDTTELSKYPFAKLFADAFLRMLFAGQGKLSDFHFKFKNRILDSTSRVILGNPGSDPEQVFDIETSWNVMSFKYLNSEKLLELYKVKKPVLKLMTGFNLIENDRAIYNGPDFSNYGDLLNGNQYPTKLLTKDLRTKNSSIYYSSSSTNSGTDVGVAGTVDVYNILIDGYIRVDNNKIFTAGANKSQVKNIEPLVDFIKDQLEFSGISVLAKWSNLLSNKFDTNKWVDETLLNNEIKHFIDKPTSQVTNPIKAFAKMQAEELSPVENVSVSKDDVELAANTENGDSYEDVLLAIDGYSKTMLNNSVDYIKVESADDKNNLEMYKISDRTLCIFADGKKLNVKKAARVAKKSILSSLKDVSCFYKVNKYTDNWDSDKLEIALKYISKNVIDEINEA